MEATYSYLSFADFIALASHTASNVWGRLQYICAKSAVCQAYYTFGLELAVTYKWAVHHKGLAQNSLTQLNCAPESIQSVERSPGLTLTLYTITTIKLNFIQDSKVQVKKKPKTTEQSMQQNVKENHN